MAKDKHTASGQMAGYLFQPDRALYLLSKTTGNNAIAVEAVDDLAIIDENGKVVYREQDKNTVKSEGKTFEDRSKDLWNTLHIWVKAAESGEFKPEETILVCATNVAITDNMVIKKISDAKTEEASEALITEIKELIKDAPQGIKEKVDYVLSKTNILKLILLKIEISENNTPANLDSQIATYLRLPKESEGEILTYLKGWVHETIVTAWSKNTPALLKIETFNKVYRNALNAYHDKKIRMTLRSVVMQKISDKDKEETKDRVFVQQLEKMFHPQLEEIILDAIDDFLCSENERTRLVEEGNITKPHLEAMDERNYERWKLIFQRHIGRVKPLSDDELGEIAHQIYNDSISGTVKLADIDAEQYLTSGSLHKLSDQPIIGWHPKWKEYFKQ